MADPKNEAKRSTYAVLRILRECDIEDNDVLDVIAKEGAERHELDGHRIALHAEKEGVVQLAQFMAANTWAALQSRSKLPIVDDEDYENALIEQCHADAIHSATQYPDEWEDPFGPGEDEFDIDLFGEFECQGVEAGQEERVNSPLAEGTAVLVPAPGVPMLLCRHRTVKSPPLRPAEKSMDRGT